MSRKKSERFTEFIPFLVLLSDQIADFSELGRLAFNQEHIGCHPPKMFHSTGLNRQLLIPQLHEHVDFLL